MKYRFLIFFILFGSHAVWAQAGFPLEFALQMGHSEYVTAVAYSPDGQYLLTGSQDHTVKLWERENGKEIRTFANHTEKIFSVTFSPDGKTGLSASKDNTAVLFEVATGKRLQVFRNTSDQLIKAVFSPLGNRILTGTDRNEMTVWNPGSDEPVGTFGKSFSGEISAGCFNPEGTRLVGYGNYEAALVFDLATGDTLFRLPFEKTYLHVYSPDGKYIAIGSNKLFAKLFNANTGQELFRFKADESVLCDGCNTEIAFSPDSKYLATGSRKDGTTLWATKTGKKVRSFEASEDRVSYLKFSPDGAYLIVATDDGVTVHNTATGKIVFTRENDLFSYFETAFRPDSKTILLPHAENTTAEWNLVTRRKEQVLRGYLNQDQNDGLEYQATLWTHKRILGLVRLKTGIALSPDGRYMVKGNVDSTALLLDVETGKVLRRFEGHNKVVYSYDFSPDGKYLVTAGADRFLIVWEVATGKEVHRLKGHVDHVFDVKFSADGQTLVSGSWDGSMRVWDVSTGKSAMWVDLKNDSPYAVGYSPDDLYLVSADLSEKLKFREMDSGEEFRTMVGHTDQISSFTFSPPATSERNLMVTGSWDGKVKVWDVLTGMLVKKFQHEGPVYTVDFDPQGQFVASGSGDRTIRLWNPVSGKEVGKLEGHSHAVTSVQITADGKRLVSCGVNGVIKVWDLESQSELYTYIWMDREEWLAMHPAGYFDGSPAAVKRVNYVMGMKVMPVASFYEKFYTPGLLNRLQKGERFGQLAPELDEFISGAPKVELAVSSTGKRGVVLLSDSVYAWKQQLLPVQVQVSGEQGELEELRIYNNGKLVFHEKFNTQLTFRGKPQNAGTFDVPLMDGRNDISVVVLNTNRTESSPATLAVEFDGKAAQTDLFLLCIGINKYDNPAYALNYAVNDAKTFNKAILGGADSLFANVHEYFLKDGAAKKAEVEATFKEIIEKVGPEDVFLFYYAGHGVMSAEGSGEPAEFYIVPPDVTNLYGDVEQLKNRAISAQELMEYSRRISATKQLFVLDACQSGGALNTFAKRGVSREKALAQLARSTGTYFLTATQDIQYANEVGELKHGIFTYALLEALSGKADGGKQDEKITVNEIKSYVEDRVPELSQEHQGSAQYPTSYSFGQDFPVVIVK